MSKTAAKATRVALLLVLAISSASFAMAQAYCVQNFTFRYTVNSLAVSGYYLFAGGLGGGNSGQVVQRNISDETSLMTNYSSSNSVMSFALNPAIERLFIPSGSGINVHQFGNATKQQTFWVGSALVAVAVNEDFLFACLTDGAVQQWQISSGMFLRNATMHAIPPCFSLAINGDNLFSGGGDGNIRWWSISRNSSGPLFFSVPRVSAFAAIASVGDFVFGAGSDKNIYKWCIGNGTLVANYSGHTSAINELVAIGDYLFSGTNAGQIKQWHTSTDRCVRTLTGYVSTISALAVSGPYLFFSGGNDKTVQQWLIPELIANYSSSSSGPSSTLTTQDSSSIFSSTDLFTTTGSQSVSSSTYSSVTTSSSDSTLPEPLPTTADCSDCSSPFITPSTTANTPSNTPTALEPKLEIINVIIIGSGAAVLLLTIILAVTLWNRRRHNLPNKLGARYLSDSTNILIQPSTTALSSKKRMAATTTRSISNIYGPILLRSQQQQQQGNNVLKSTFQGIIDANVTKTEPIDTTLYRTAQLKVLSIPGAYQVDARSSFVEIERIFANHQTMIYRARPANEDLLARAGGKEVVVKRIRVARKEQSAAFYQELSIMYLFADNDLFVKLVGYTDPPHYAIITVYYPLGSLDRALYKQRAIRLTSRLKVQFAREISTALHFMHSQGFAHCDLKPHNVFLEHLLLPPAVNKYRCKLADFGLARVLDQENYQVQAYDFSSQRGLTTAYASPQAIQRFRKRGLNSTPLQPVYYTSNDVYSLACVVYELLMERGIW